MSDIVTPQVNKPADSRWWHRKLEPEQRQRVLKDLAIQKPDKWELRFGIMLSLSVVVAVMGLQLNSAAVVIGAMLLAPLMQPVLASAACLSMGLFDKAGVVVLRVLVATAGCIAIAFILAALLPEQLNFTPEVLSRTAPETRDLIVALAAGAAGSYATVREDASASLPGVAVAVALVPPLGAVGVTLQAGDFEKARGAMLLYSTNLVAIVLVGVFVFVLTGFVAPRRLQTNYIRVAIAVLGMSFLVALVGVPLVRASRSAAQDSRDNATAFEIVDQWRSDTDDIDEVDVEENFVRVILRGTGQPPDDTDLKANLAIEFPERETLVEWIRVGIPATTTTTINADDSYAAEVEFAVETWVATLSDAELDGFSLDGNALRADISGIGEPPSAESLSEALTSEFDTSFAVRINWSERVAIIGADEVDPIEEVEQQLRLIADNWAIDESQIVDSFDFDGATVAIQVRGLESPSVDSLEDEITEYLETLQEEQDGGVGFELSVLYSQQVELVN